MVISVSVYDTVIGGGEHGDGRRATATRPIMARLANGTAPHRHTPGSPDARDCGTPDAYAETLRHALRTGLSSAP